MIGEILAQVVHTAMQIAGGVEMIWIFKLLEAGTNIFAR